MSFMRVLLWVHRYLGLALGVLMLMWCLSGIVMMYERYPELSPAQRLSHLPAIEWRGCCTVSDAALSDDARVSQLQVEMMGPTVVLRLSANGRRSLIDLSSGHARAMLSSREAAAIAAGYSRAAQIPGSLRLEGEIDHDQWTVAGLARATRPLFLLQPDDSARTSIYVSALTGQVVQVTNAHSRFWSWLGAIPHWLYFTELRRNAALWSQVVIWSSLTGCFLTLLGLYIGVRRFLERPRGRSSPYRGVLLWHHLPGLIFGFFVLTWVASGLVSMNPWGFLESDSGVEAGMLLHGAPLTGSQVKATVQALAAQARPDTVSVSAAPLLGHLYLVATSQDGTRARLDETAAPAPLSARDWMQIAQALSVRRPGEAGLLTGGDAYYYSEPSDRAQAVYRIISDDEERTRYYLDPVTACLLASFDSPARAYRWLHQGLHTLDFSPLLRGRPQWDILMLSLLAGAAAVCATGTYAGYRRLLKR